MQKYKITPKPNWAIAVAFTLSVLMITACTSDQLPEPSDSDCSSLTPTYTDNIQPIIEQSCAFSGCHLDNAPGVFDSYSGLLPVLEDGKFFQRVIVERSDAIKGMPPNNAPVGRPQDLTENEIQLIDCWLQAGHPE